MVKYKNSNSLNLYYQTSCRIILLFMCNAFSLQAARMYYHNKCSFINESGEIITYQLEGSNFGDMNSWKVVMQEDGVFVMYHRNSNNTPLLVKPSDWVAEQNKGEVADGVLVCDGGRLLVVSPTEATLPWSSAAVAGGGFTSNDRVAVYNDWNGKANTASQIKLTECNKVSHAPGFCAAYSRANSNGKGLTAGKWWLPSMGELMLISANFRKINYALSMIKDAEQISTAWYWSSTEANNNVAWDLLIGNNSLDNWRNKVTDRGRVRPVSAFIE